VDFRKLGVGLHGEVTDEYVYGVTQLELSVGNAPTCLVRMRHFRDLDGATPSGFSQHNHETSIGAVLTLSLLEIARACFLV